MTINRRHITAAALANIGLVYLTLRGTMVTVADRLTERAAAKDLDAAATTELVTRYGSWAGRHTATLYREIAGHEPVTVKVWRDGDWRNTFAYAPAALVIIDAALAAYKRTACLY